MAGQGSPITVTDVTRVFQMLEASRNASRFVDTIEYAMLSQVSGITERVTFCSKLFVDSSERWAGSVSANYLYILENLQIQSLLERPTKPAHLQLIPSALDTSNNT